MKLKSRVLSYLFDATKKNRLAVLTLIAIETGLGLVNIGFVLTMRSALDGAAVSNHTALQSGLWLMMIFIFIRLALRSIWRTLDERVRSRVENNLKARLFRHLLHGEYARIEATHTGEWMNRLTSDSAVVANGVTEILPSLSGMLVKLIGAAVMIIAMIPQVSYFLLPAGLLAIFITWVLRKSMKKYHKMVQESDGRLRTFLQERLSSMMIVRAFQAENAVEQASAMKMADHKRARMRRNLISNICNTGFAGLMNGLYIVSFAYCSYGMIAGNISYGTLLAVIQLIGQIQAPFAGLSGVIPRVYSTVASAERLMEAEAYPQEPMAESQTDVNFSELCFDHVGFAYPESEKAMVLSDINLVLHAGDYVALTGHSGCGKSTLFKLLLCLYHPVNGNLSILSPSGDKTHLSPAHRALFAYVPQGNQLMSGTIREVVTFARSDGYDSERIQRALQIACADTFVNTLENGLDTFLGERGAGLSEGQMQRLAIARAIYSGAPILLLDEATSALDEETERQVLCNLKLMTNITVLIVTHRSAALEICNRVFLLEGGSLCVVKD